MLCGLLFRLAVMVVVVDDAAAVDVVAGYRCHPLHSSSRHLDVTNQLSPSPIIISPIHSRSTEGANKN